MESEHAAMTERRRSRHGDRDGRRSRGHGSAADAATARASLVQHPDGRGAAPGPRGGRTSSRSCGTHLETPEWKAVEKKLSRSVARRRRLRSSPGSPTG